MTLLATYIQSLGPRPSDGWQRGTVARLCPRGASRFSHVVAYTRQTSARRGTADTLLDAASYGARWVLLCLPLVPGRGRPARRLGGPGSPLWPGPGPRP